MRFFVSILCLCLVGCVGYLEQAEVAQQSLQSGDFETLANVALTASQSSSNESLLWQLEAGAALRAQGKIQESVDCFERVERALRAEEERADFSVSEEVAGAFSNDYAQAYRPKPADRIYASTYQLLNWIELGDLARARISLTRLRFVQERWGNRQIYVSAKPQSDREIEVAKASQEGSAKIALDQIEQDLASYGTNSTFDDAFSHWLQGVFLMHTAQEASDYERARKELLAAHQLNPDCSVIRADQVDVEKLQHGQSLARLVYVVVEKGHSAEWYEQRIDFPAFLFSDRVQFISVALPAIRPAQPDYPLALHLDGQDLALSSISRPEALVAQHFAASFPAVKTRAIISATTKAASAYAINQSTERREQRKQDNESRWLRAIGQIGTGVYTIASTQADLRHWRSLPARFSVARVSVPAGSKLSVVGRPEVTCVLPEGKVLLVSLKSSSEYSPVTLRCSVIIP